MCRALTKGASANVSVVMVTVQEVVSDEEVDAGFRGLFTKLAGSVRVFPSIVVLTWTSRGDGGWS